MGRTGEPPVPRKEKRGALMLPFALLLRSESHFQCKLAETPLIVIATNCVCVESTLKCTDDDRSASKVGVVESQRIYIQIVMVE